MLSTYAAPGDEDDLTALADAVGVSGSRFTATCALGCGRPVPDGQVACGQCG